MPRASAIAVVLLALGALGLWGRWRPMSGPVPTPCPDGGALRLGTDGVARCDGAAALPAGQALTLGQKFDCNTATAEDLALVPGIGATLARDLVAARGAGWSSWDEVDAVPGVGAARLRALQDACEIRWLDAGM